jgi:hypothetical protein
MSLLPEVPAAVVSVEDLTGVVSLEAEGFPVVSLAGFTGVVSRGIGFAGTVSLGGGLPVVSWEKEEKWKKTVKHKNNKALQNHLGLVRAGVLIFINSLVELVNDTI